MQNILCWSGGKDSTASLILCYEKHIRIDEVIFSEVMYDKDISGENPLFIKWVYEIGYLGFRKIEDIERKIKGGK